MGLLITQVFFHFTLGLVSHRRCRTCSRSVVIKATNRSEKLHRHYVLNNCSRKAELKTLGKLSVANISLHVEIFFFHFRAVFKDCRKCSLGCRENPTVHFCADAAATAVCEIISQLGHCRIKV